uniref:Uncharacterized protein n=1 Tax=Chelonoidis abingdonii TaxID=106734 RepID=A0A8C0GD90_CHEAB
LKLTFSLRSFHPRPWHRQDVSANPRAHVVRVSRTKPRCWWAAQPGCCCRVPRGAWSCIADTEQLCLLSLLPREHARGLGAALQSCASQPRAGRSKQRALGWGEGAT